MFHHVLVVVPTWFTLAFTCVNRKLCVAFTHSEELPH